ncbi:MULTISPECIES: hypothetical protein [Flagellimonas]|uniref:Periplasmic heavy metal sensor n=1 Tax=Flagellimonas hadalis TaxID=2597517 RepID=A0A5N5IQW6_9FLAO|nr:hypothetical protein [Allomuricauda hadalis]KAB5486896.1 hypothetical protein FOT42_012095 [Allomuricauda hadalis]RUA15986.1 MAG: hypothetical protein DSY83_06480 [Flavobacteriia bacterium]
MKRVIFYLFLISGLYGSAQMDCILGVGGPDGDTMVQVFQLNEEQQEKLKSWAAELKVRNDILREKAEYLMKKNENSTPEVLLEVSKQYRAIQDSMFLNVRMMDKRLLTIFNDKQYQRYLGFCNELALRPIHVNRSIDEK